MRFTLFLYCTHACEFNFVPSLLDCIEYKSYVHLFFKDIISSCVNLDIEKESHRVLGFL